jgi:Ras family protein A
LICFAVDHPSSFEVVEVAWITEVKLHLPKVPVVLVGLKTDLRTDPETLKRLSKIKQSVVSRDDGLKVAKKIGAYAYVECSALTYEGVEEVFETAARAALKMKKKKMSCILL